MKKSLIIAIFFATLYSCAGYRVRNEYWNGGESYMYTPVVDKSSFNGTVVTNMSPGEAALFYKDANEWFYSQTKPKLIAFVDPVKAPVITTSQLAYGVVGTPDNPEVPDIVRSLENSMNFPFFMEFSGANFSYGYSSAAITQKQGIFLITFTNETMFPAKEIVFVDVLEKGLQVINVYGIKGGFFNKIENNAVWEIVEKAGTQYIIVKIDFKDRPLKKPFSDQAAIAIVVEEKK